MWRYGNWVGVVVAVIVGWLCESSAAKGAIDVVSWKSGLEELNEGDLLTDIV